MKITIHRNPGLYGYILDLSVTFNGEKVCDISRNETKNLILPASEGLLEVNMGPLAFSRPLIVNPADTSGFFVCGVRWWAAFDPIGLNMLCPKVFPVFYLNRKESA